MGKKKDDGSSAENIKVIVRCRPLNSKEKDSGYNSCVDLDMAESTVTVNHLCGNPDRWTFDGVVNNSYSQKDIFTQFIMPMVDSVMDGFNATVFAYGQSGSGKTHTMTGVYDDEDLKGIIPRSFRHIFETVKQQQSSNPNKRFTLYCSFCELYNGKVRDLLAKQQVPLAVKENKDKTFFIQGAHIPQVKFEEELYRLMEEGTERRVVDATELNATSSRSHSIFTIVIECTETSDDGDTRSVTSKLNLVDLAGSERQSKTGATGDTLKEGCNINLSLSALGTVIDTLVKGKGHIPFRSSPLTMLLKDSLGGSSKTCMFANIGPSEHNVSETVSSLRFADRAKQIKNKPVVNMDSKDQKIAELTEQVAELKAKLHKFESGGFGELEAEVEELRDRCGELEIDRENAVKGREADGVDFERASQALQQQLASAGKAKEELDEQVSRLTDELRLAEELSGDVSRQSKEIFAMCSAELGDEIENVDALVKKVRELNNGVTRKQYETVQRQCTELQTELETLQGQHEHEVAKLSAAAKRAEEELHVGQRKLEKVKDQLHTEQHARKQLVENHSEGLSPHRSASFSGPPSLNAEEVTQLKDAIRVLEEEKESNEQIRRLEEQLKAVTEEKTSTIESLMKQVESLTAQLTVGEGEGDEKSQATRWQKILKAKDEALTRSRTEVAALEKQLEEHRHIKQSRRRASVYELSEKREDLFKQQRDNLKEDLQTTSEHRDSLLDQVLSGKEVDLANTVQTLHTENARLKERLKEVEEQQDELLASKKISSGGEIEIARIQGQLESERKMFEEKESKLLAALAKASSGAGGEEEEENPLQSVVNVLRTEKQQLLSSVDHLNAQLRSMRSNGATGEQTKEIDRLHALLNAPHGGDSEVVSELREELRRRDDEVKQLTGAGAGGDLDSSTLLAEQSRVMETEIRHQTEVFEVDKQRLGHEVDSLKADLAEEAERRTKLEEEMSGALQQVADAKKETAEEHRKAKQAENEIEAARAEFERVLKDASQYTTQISHLEERVEERTAQLKKLRDTLQNQRSMMDKLKLKLENQQQTLNSAKQELALKDQQHHASLEDQAEYLQKVTNKKLEQQAEEHKKALVRKDNDMHSLRKKLKKLEDKLEKAKGKYDEKVLDFAELQSRMEEQKIEQMQAMKEQQVVQIETGQDLIRDTLQDAKEAQRRKADLFAQGEVPSALANLRAAGNAAVALRGSKLAPGTGRGSV